MNKTPNTYIGMSLLFGTRTADRLWIERVYFLAKTRSLSDTIKFAAKIGNNRSFGNMFSKKEFIKYLGLEHVFGVVGPMGHGAMMGQTSKFSYKDMKDVGKLLDKREEFVINQKGVESGVDELYIAKLVYFLGRPVPYKSRRALVCWAVVKSADKRKVMKAASKLAQSTEFKEKLVLRDYDEVFSPRLLEFVGICDIRPLFEKLRVGNYFLNSSREIKSISEIKRVRIPNPAVFRNFFKEDNKK